MAELIIALFLFLIVFFSAFQLFEISRSRLEVREKLRVSLAMGALAENLPTEGDNDDNLPLVGNDEGEVVFLKDFDEAMLGERSGTLPQTSQLSHSELDVRVATNAQQDLFALRGYRVSSRLKLDDFFADQIYFKETLLIRDRYYYPSIGGLK